MPLVVKSWLQYLGCPDLLMSSARQEEPTHFTTNGIWSVFAYFIRQIFGSNKYWAADDTTNVSNRFSIITCTNKFYASLIPCWLLKDFLLGQFGSHAPVFFISSPAYLNPSLFYLVWRENVWKLAFIFASYHMLCQLQWSCGHMKIPSIRQSRHKLFPCSVHTIAALQPANIPTTEPGVISNCTTIIFLWWCQ